MKHALSAAHRLPHFLQYKQKVPVLLTEINYLLGLVSRTKSNNYSFESFTCVLCHEYVDDNNNKGARSSPVERGTSNLLNLLLLGVPNLEITNKIHVMIKM